MNNKGLITMLITAVILVLLASAFTLFLVKKGSISVKNEDNVIDNKLVNIRQNLEIPELKIVSVKFCDYIDEIYNCFENDKGEFEQFSNLYLLIEADGIESAFIDTDYKIRYTQSRAVFSPTGAVVEAASRAAVDKEKTVDGPGKFYALIKNQLFIKPYALPGEYEIDILVKDKNSGRTAKSKKKFKVIVPR